jgi:hypothetical protein
MAGTSTLPESEIMLNDLILDDSNPRFAQLYTGKSQDDIINYLLDEEDARDLAKEILHSGTFRQDKKLWVLKQHNGKYLIKDGNRRCAAVKALQEPKKYGLPKSLPFSELPVIIYDNEALLNEHIQGEHTSASKRDWSRIAKALEIQRLANAKASKADMQNIDSDVAPLLRVANFYEKAVIIAKNKLKELLRNSGVKGRKLIVFERMFGVANECGYSFGGIKSNCALTVNDKKKFETYVKNIVNYLQNHPEITHINVDKKADQLKFLTLINSTSKNSSNSKSGTSAGPSTSGATSGGNNSPQSSGSTPPITPTNKGSVKTKPKYRRKEIPPQVKKVMDELYELSSNKYYNSKAAMTRIALELALKFVVERTKYDGKHTMNKTPYFQNVFPPKSGQYTDASSLKEKFADIVKDSGIRKTLKNFDLDKPSQAIHNYHVGIGPLDATQWCNGIIDILEFILDDEVELLKNLDILRLQQPR